MDVWFAEKQEPQPRGAIASLRILRHASRPVAQLAARFAGRARPYFVDVSLKLASVADASAGPLDR